MNSSEIEQPDNIFMIAAAITKGYSDCLNGNPAISDDEHYLQGYALQYEQGERETANEQQF